MCRSLFEFMLEVKHNKRALNMGWEINGQKTSELVAFKAKVILIA